MVGTNAGRRALAGASITALGLLAACGDGGNDPGTSSSSSSSSSTSPAVEPTSTATPTTSGPVETLGAGDLIELPKDTEWIEPTDEPHRFAMPSDWDLIDVRAVVGGAQPDEGLQDWAKERKIDLAKLVASDAKAGWSVRLLKTEFQSDPGPVAYVLSRWRPGNKIANAKAAVGELKATGIKTAQRQTPLGPAWIVTGNVKVGNRTLPMGRVLVNAPEGLARIHIVATSAAQRQQVMDTIARTISYR